MTEDEWSCRAREKEYPACFGVLENVFPEGADGMRHSPESCMVCHCKTDCLRVAMGKNEGLEVREACVDRAYDSGMIGFLDRWSRKKKLHRQRKTQSE
jgi:hypothetical protein